MSNVVRSRKFTAAPPRPPQFNLPSAVSGALPTDNTIRVGVVSSVDNSRRVTVLVGGGYLVAGYLASYAPRVGDVVALARQDATWLILGVIGGTGGTNQAIGLNQLGAVVIGTQASLTLASSASGVPVLVNKYKIRVKIPAGHHCLVRARFSWHSTVSADWVQVNLRAGETATSPTVGEFVEPIVSSGFGRSDSIEGVARADVYGGTTQTFVMTLNRLSGTGTATIAEVSSRPGYLAAYAFGDETSTPDA